MSSIEGVTDTGSLNTLLSSQQTNTTYYITNVLDSLVSSGTITQDQETAVQNTITSSLQSGLTGVSASSSSGRSAV